MKVTFKGNLISNPGGITASLMMAMGKAAIQIADVVKLKAREHYLAKKLSQPKLPSMVFESIDYEGLNLAYPTITVTVYAGGPRGDNPVRAIYLDKGHKKRDGMWWEGYHFMDIGWKAGQHAKHGIVKTELRKMLGVGWVGKIKGSPIK